MANSKPSERVCPPAVLAASTLSGLVEGIVVQPLDFVKSVLQAQSYLHKTSLTFELCNTYQNRGLMGFYRGSLAEISSLLPRTCAMMTTFELTRRHLAQSSFPLLNYIDHQRRRDQLISWIAGLVSGIPEALVVTPFQVIKLRLIMSDSSLYRNSFDCAAHIFNHEGLSALLFTGLSPTLFRNCIWNSVYFASMHRIRDSFQMINEKDDHTPPLLSVNEWALTLFGGFFAGIFATVFNCPFDVLKSRFQSQKIRELRGLMKQSDYRYRFTLPSLFHIFQSEGIRGCYAGFIAKSARMGVGGAVAIAAFESFSALFLIAGFERNDSRLEMSYSYNLKKKKTVD